MDTAQNSAFSISPQELGQRIREGSPPLLLAVCRTPRFATNTHMLVGTTRCAPEDVPVYAAAHPAGDVVVYCVYGHEVGQGAAAALRAAGWNAQFLAGGMEGGEDGVDTAANIAQWRADAPPRMIKRPDLGVAGEAPSRWITRERPKIDRIACPWLIQRFIDPRAEFFYVPTAQVFQEAKRLQATAYDIPGAPISHTGPQGALCSFDALLAAFELKIPALDMLACIVRGADTDHLGLTSESAGLLAISLGMSSLHQDDHVMLQAMLPVYDALYRSCVRTVNLDKESHNWKPETLQQAAI